MDISWLTWWLTSAWYSLNGYQTIRVYTRGHKAIDGNKFSPASITSNGPSSIDGVLELSVVTGMRAVGGVGVCLATGGMAD